MRIQEISRYEDWIGIKERWDGLVSESANNNFFSTFEWLSSWWRHFGEGRSLLILLVMEEERITGLVPWMISPGGRKGFSYRKIEFIGAGSSDWADLILPEADDRKLDLIAEHLERRSDAWDVASFWEMKEGKLSEAFFEAVARRKLTSQVAADSVCPFIRLEGTWEDFYNERTTAKSRSYRRRDLKRMEKNGALRFRVLHDLSAEPGIAEAIFQLGRQACPDIFGDREQVGFLRETLAALSRAGRLQVPVLELDKELVCFFIGFVYNDQFLAYLTGYDRRYSYGSPGEATLHMLLEHCFAAGMKQFHFLRGPEAYKFKWASELQRNRRIELFRGFKGALLYRYRRIKALRKA
jgi:CelD/BcsL family acetyltransferase involved in cellulose biosynthesis